MRVSLGRRAVREKARIWGRATRDAERMAERTKKGVILLAIVSDGLRGRSGGRWERW